MFIPREDSETTIELPGERLRARVHRILDANTIIVELTRQPLSKSHTYRLKDMLIAKRQRTALEEVWVVEEVPRAPEVSKPKKTTKKPVKKIVKKPKKK